MLVFIDESGDAGFKLESGSSPIFVIAMVIFESSESARDAQDVLSATQRELRAWPEFKFSKLSPQNKDAFFLAVRDLDFRVRAIVVQKDRIRSNSLRTIKESFYKYFSRQLVEKGQAGMLDAKIIIDGSGDKVFQRELQRSIKRNLPTSCVREVRLKDSQKDVLIQLADMAAGAIARSYRKDRRNADKWRRLLRASGNLEDVWEFK